MTVRERYHNIVAGIGEHLIIKYIWAVNSYTVWFLYQFIQCLYELYSTNLYKV